MDLGQIQFVSWFGVREEEDDRILQNSDFYLHYDVIMRQNRVKNVFFMVEGAFLDGSWPKSWLGVGEEEDDRILRNSDFYPHYDIIMGQNRAKNRFFRGRGRIS